MSTHTIDVRGCQRCGHDHALIFHPLSNPADRFTHWAICPRARQPLLLAITPAHCTHHVVVQADNNAMSKAELMAWAEGLPAIGTAAKRRHQDSQGASHCFSGLAY